MSVGTPFILNFLFLCSFMIKFFIRTIRKSQIKNKRIGIGKHPMRNNRVTKPSFEIELCVITNRVTNL